MSGYEISGFAERTFCWLSKLSHVFISHGKQDSWVAGQISKEICEFGASTFLDETNIKKGDDFKKTINREIGKCTELVALFTPWSAQRAWVWVEVGAAWGQGKRIVAILHGMGIEELERVSGGRAILEDINIFNINELEGYLCELRERVGEVHD